MTFKCKSDQINYIESSFKESRNDYIMNNEKWKKKKKNVIRLKVHRLRSSIFYTLDE